MNKVIISGTGCALIDYLYPGISFSSSSFLKYRSKSYGDGGLLPGRLVFRKDLEQFSGKSYSEILSDITNGSTPSSFNLGGPGLVSMIHVAQMLWEDVFEVRFFGGTGNDETAELIFDLVQKTPLDISNYLKLGDKATPFTDVLSDPEYDNGHGERTFINNIGAAYNYSPDYLHEGSFFNSDIVCFGGTALVPVIHDNLGMLLRKAQQNNCISIVSTVFDFRSEKNNPGKNWPIGHSPADLNLIDLLIMDNEEALKISGQEHIEQATDYFIQNKVPAFIITDGAQNIIAFSDGSIFNDNVLLNLPISSRVSNDLKNQQMGNGDTTGCGDNFTGGVIASIGKQLLKRVKGQLDFTEAIAWGVASGGLACFYLGGTYFEKEIAEKYHLVKKYHDHYLLQIDNT